MLGLFGTSWKEAVWSNFRIIEFVIFAGCLYLLRKYKTNAIAIIWGSGVVGAFAYLAAGLLL